MTPLARITRLSRTSSQVRHDLKTAIREGRDKGYTLEELGRAAGVSRQAIHQLLREEQEK